MMEIERQKIKVIMATGKNHQWMLKLVHESIMRNKIFASLNVSPHNKIDRC